MDGPRYSFPMETMYATGCCLCIKASDFEKLNRFDNAFTMYCEDVDLSVRAKQGNNKIIYSPESIILHSVSQSLGDNSFEKIRPSLLFHSSLTGELILNSPPETNFQIVLSFGNFVCDLASPTQPWCA